MYYDIISYAYYLKNCNHVGRSPQSSSKSASGGRPRKHDRRLGVSSCHAPLEREKNWMDNRLEALVDRWIAFGDVHDNSSSS